MKKYLLIVFVSLSFLTVAEEAVLDCDSAMTTLQINYCASIELALAQAELAQYLEATFEHKSHDPELVKSIKVSQEDWLAYRSSHCDSVYTQWRDGTIRGVMAISCKTKLTKQRTHEIWTNFLTYMDDTPPVLAEPGVE